jgi:hypothetical protein
VIDAEAIGVAALANLRAANERKAAKGQALYAEIRAVVDT